MTKANQTTHLHCRCGAVEMQAEGSPVMSVECLCDSCREAAARMAALPGAVPITEATGATRVEMFRKDRVRCTKGAELLREFRLNDKTATRRVIAICCNTPIFMEFTKGHWIDLYGTLWPQGTLPPLQLRTMVGDLDDTSVLPDDVPNLKTHSAGFFARLMLAWVKMGFRSPAVDYVQGQLDHA